MLEAEFTRTAHARGTVSMARASAKNSADSQWFIVLSEANRSSLDGQYTVWGQVTAGMEFVDKIKKGNASRNGAVPNPDKIVRLRIAADAERQGQAMPDAATAREFNGPEFRCAVLGENTDQAALAPVWAHGYLAGAYKAQNKLTFMGGAGSGFDSVVQKTCTSSPQAFLISAVGQDLAGAPRDLPNATAAFPAGTYTCKDYVAARDGTNKSEADFAEMWGFAFMQGFKAVNQPGLEMPFAAKAQLLGAVAANCAKNPEVTFANLAALVAEKVKLK